MGGGRHRTQKYYVRHVYIGLSTTGPHINIVHGGDIVSRGVGISINSSWKILYSRDYTINSAIPNNILLYSQAKPFLISSFLIGYKVFNWSILFTFMS